MRTAQPESRTPSLEQAYIPPLRSLLDPEALRAEVQRAYHIGPVQRCTLLRSLTNDVYEVATADRPYILKVYGHGWRSLGEVAWEVDLLAHLAGNDLPIPSAIVRADGRGVGTVHAPEGVRPTVLFASAEGAKPTGPSAALYHTFGQALAHIHLAAQDFASRHHRDALDIGQLVDRALAVISPYLARRPEDHAFVERLASTARERLIALAAGDLTWGVCHGDVSLDNIHVTPEGRIIVYDFDSAAPGWQASDFAGVMTWLTRGQPEFWDAFLRGYQESRPLTQADVAALPWLVPIALLDNMRWHLTSWLEWRGALALDEGYLEREGRTLRQWDRDVLRSDAASG